MAGINSGSVRRLAHTWGGLSARPLEVLLVLEEFINSEENWKAYRQATEKAREQKQFAIPYLGVILKV